jgi:hypothetical protein
MNIINIIIYLFILTTTIASTISFNKLNKIKNDNEDVWKQQNLNDVFTTNSIILFMSWFVFIIFLIYFISNRVQGGLSKKINSFLTD